MRRIPFYLLLCFALALPTSFMTAGHAQDEAMQVALTEAHLEGFIGIMPELRRIAESHGADTSDGSSELDIIAGMARSQKTMAELDALLKKNGFKDISEWTAVAVSITAAYNWLSEAGDPVEDLAAQIEQLQADRNLSGEQKAALVAALENQRALIAEMRPPEANLALVGRYRDQIADVLVE